MRRKFLHQKWRSKYTMQKGQAKFRGIAFDLTFFEWFKIWTDSGHLHERGRRKYEYVMARLGDKGAYAIGNVRIIRQDENSAEKQFTFSKSAKRRMSISAKKRDRSSGYSKAHALAISEGVRRSWVKRRANLLERSI